MAQQKITSLSTLHIVVSRGGLSSSVIIVAQTNHGLLLEKRKIKTLGGLHRDSPSSTLEGGEDLPYRDTSIDR